MIDTKPVVLDRAMLRKFGLTMGCAFAGIFGLLFPILKSRAIPVWPWLLAGAFWGFAAFFPLALARFYRVWMKFGLVLGKVNSRIVLGVFFFLIITPVAAVLKLLRKNFLDTKLDKSATTYRKVSSDLSGQSRYQNPY